jgi:hypothetical protein
MEYAASYLGQEHEFFRHCSRLETSPSGQYIQKPFPRNAVRIARGFAFWAAAYIADTEGA